MNITFFTIPKAFRGHWAIAQNNAIKSWMCLNPDKIILFGRDGREAARRLGCVYSSVRLHTRFKIPLVSDAFYRVQGEATTRLIGLVLSDMILMDDFSIAVAQVAAHFDDDFLMVGNRYGHSVKGPLDFSTNWQEQLREQTKNSKWMHGIDYFVFTRGLYCQVPEFLIGRREWDCWLVHHARQRKIPVVDTTLAVRAVHQDPPQKQATHKGASALKYNRRLAGESLKRKGRANKAPWMLTEDFELVER